jgi:stage II sporulation protein D
MMAGVRSRLPLTVTALGAAALVWCAAAVLAAGQAPPPGAAWLVRPLDGQGAQRESRADILDTPVLPGSIVKAVALVAALEAGVITARTTHLCRRVVTVDGHTYTCAHPILPRALTPSEALAYSCNDFFLSLAPRLSREAVNAVRVRAGLPVVSASTTLSAALVGLDGPRVPPRALVDVVARLAGVGPRPVPMHDGTRRVLVDGLRGAAAYGTASAFGERRVTALAKTGTAPMPGGGTMGLVVALAPADAPARAAVVVAPGAAGLDAASIAADLLRPSVRSGEPSGSPASGSSASVNATADKEGPQRTGVTALRIGRTRANGTARVEPVDLDAYIAEVVAGEAPAGADGAALEALAITARTYALVNRGRHAPEGFDLCDTTHCQALRPPTSRARQAAAATSGRVLLTGTRLAHVYHSAWCGGHPERPSEVWPGAAGGAPAVRDDACEGEPGWSSELRASDLERAFTAAGLRGGRLRDLRVVARNRTGRVTRLRVDGWAPAELSGQEFRTIVGRHLGWQHVRSTLFDLERTAIGYRISGRGFGHGAGLCVLGATRRAQRGATPGSILSFYFPDLSIGAVPGGVTSDVKLALPGEESAERRSMLALLRRARDEIAKAAGVDERPALTVTVHPTVESFGRATGHPWFVAGATHGSKIDLLPITVLRRNGTLERVVRHEVAHALLDRHLEGRPLWVREGAAAYFAANASAQGGVHSPLTCPSDGELRRPASAAAQRDSYARAEACFADRLRSGAPWRAVK